MIALVSVVGGKLSCRCPVVGKQGTITLEGRLCLGGITCSGGGVLFGAAPSCVLICREGKKLA